MTAFNSRDFLTDSLNAVDAGAGCSPKILLFQAGCLTVGRTEKKGSGKKKFYLRSPNLDAEAAMAVLWLFLDSPTDNPLLMKRQARAVPEALIRKKAGDFQNAFRSFLAALPWELKLGYEACFNTVFLLAVNTAGQTWDCQGPVGDGRFDVRLKTRDGNDYIIEMKHVRTKDKGRALAPEEVRLKKEEAVREAMDQTEKNKYALKFQGLNNKIYKTALAAAGRNDVLLVFEEAENWTLELDPSENFYGVPGGLNLEM
jgi:hypothetical protein